MKETVPNPFAGVAEIGLDLDESGIVTLELFDVTGRRVIRRSELLQRGSCSLPVGGLARGAYYYRVSCGTGDGSRVVGTGRLISLGP